VPSFDDLSEVVGREVEWHRRRLQLTRQQLADQCLRLGSDLTFAAVTSIETGRRDNDGRRRRAVTVDELVVLAQALQVAPLALVAPARSDDPTAWAPNRQAHPWTVAKWFSSEQHEIPIGSESELDAYGFGLKDPETGLHGWYEIPKSITTELDLWRAHERAWNDWWRSRHRAIAARRLAADATDPAVSQSRTIEADAEDLYRLQVIERDLQKVRAEMRGSGIELPILAEGMEHIDGEKKRQR
jgi:hypothetical protein